MPLALLMDVHVPRAVTAGLRRRGLDVLTAQEDESDTLEDPRLLDRAAELGRVLFTQDDDLLQEAARRQAEGVAFSGVVYTHQLRLTIGQCVEELALLAELLDPAYMDGRVEYLPL